MVAVAVVEDLMRVQYLIILLVLLEHISFQALLEDEEVHDDPNERLGFLALEAEPLLERLPLPVKGVEGIHSLLYLVDFIAYEIHIT